MNFSNSNMFFLIWLIPFLFFLIFYGINKKKKILDSFLSKKAKTRIFGLFSFERLWLKNLLILTALLFIIIALAGPLVGYKWREVERKGIDIVVAVDCSKSMLARDIKPSRLARAKMELNDFLNMLKGDRIALVAFAGESFLQCPLTLDYEAFNIFISSLSPENLPLGGTNFSNALKVAVDAFDKDSNNEKAIILITDGESTEKENIDKIIEELKKERIKVFTIGIGKKEGTPIVDENGNFKKDENGNIVITKIDEDNLKQIAISTGGIFVLSEAGDMDLDLIYEKEIREKMNLSTLKGGKEKIWENRFQYPLCIAIILLIIEFFIPIKKTLVLIILLFLFNISNANASQSKNFNDGVKSYNNENYEDALKKFTDVELEDPENPKLHYNIGNAYYKLNGFQSAEKHFKKSLETKDKNLQAKAYYNLGNTYYKMQNYDEAIKNYEHSLKINPNDEEAKKNIEFIKNLKKDNKNQSDNQNQNNKNQDQDKKENQDKKDGQDKKDNKNNKKEENKEDKKKENQNKENQKQDNKKEEERKKEEEEAIKKANENKKKQQAKQVLDRLKEIPPKQGQELVPYYEKRNVEKDW